MLKKILALLLVILMAAPAIVACGNTSDTPKQTINYETEEGGEENAEEDPLIGEIDEYVAELAGQYSFKGETFTWLGPSWQAPEKDEETGDAEDDAMYFRQRDIEDMFGLEWVNNKAEMVVDDGDSATIELIKQDVMAGTGAYDASYAGNMHTQQLLINDCLMNLTDFSTVDLDGEWWQQDLKGTLSIGGELYFLQGSIVSSYYQDAQCIVFNKDVAEDYGIEGLYDLARDGEWTFDKMIELANTVPENANGAGAYRYSGINGYTVVHAHGYSITEFDEAGNPYVPDAVPQTIVDIADKYSVIFGDESQTAHTKWYSTTNYETFEDKYGYKNEAEMFADGKILFLMTNTGGGAELRTHDVNFGFLPIPKGSDAQENYISYVEPWSAVNVFVPKSAKDPQMTDVILEAMAALGYKYFKSTCYDNMLKSRTVKDMESKEMLDIIFNTKRYDIINIVDKGASVYGDGELMNWLNGSVQETSAGMVSKYFIKSKIINSNIKTILGNIQSDINN